MTRSKSVTSNTSELLVASEAKARSTHRRPVVEMRDSSTQTMCDAGTQTFAAEEAAIAREIAAISEMAEIEGLGDDEDEGQTGWLDKHIRMQGELEMALRSGMELIAERGYSLPPQPLPPDGQPPAGTRRPGARHASAAQTSTNAAAAARGPDHMSDGEGHEDDEVRSLSLSEDGPVICRSFGCSSLERSRCAPDPIAMLSDGQHKLYDHLACSDGGLEDVRSGGLPAQQTLSEPMLHEQGSDRSGATPNDSDRSGASTHLASALERTDADWGGNDTVLAAGHMSPHDGYTTAFEHLTPILSKMAGHLEVVQENTDADTSRSRSERGVGGLRVPATRVRALRCSSSLESLNLSEVHLRDNAETRPQSARSDVSFGSASSAFTCLSSSTSGSHNPLNTLSPPAHVRRSLTGTVSMPSLLQTQSR